MPDYHLLLATGSTGSTESIVGWSNVEGSDDFVRDVVLPSQSLNGPNTSKGDCSEFARYVGMPFASSPYFRVYKRNGKVFTTVPISAYNPTGAVHAVACTRDGVYWAVTFQNSPRAGVYKRVGDTIPTRLSLPDAGTSSGRGAAFSPDSRFLAMGFVAGANLNIYERDGDNFTRIAQPSIPSYALSAEWSPDRKYLAIGTSADGLRIFKFDGVTFVDVSDGIDFQFEGSGRSVAWNRDGTRLAMLSDAEPYVAVYEVGEDTFSVIANPEGFTDSSGAAVAFSRTDTEYLAIGASGGVQLFKWDGDTYEPVAIQDNMESIASSLVFTPALYTGHVELYERTVYNLLSGGVDLENLKIALLSSDASFTPSDDTLSKVTGSGAYEVYGNNWPQGGVSLANVQFEFAELDGAKLVLDTVYENIVGGDLTAAAAVIYDDSHPDDMPLAFIDFDGDKTAEDGRAFTFEFPDSGLIHIQKV